MNRDNEIVLYEANDGNVILKVMVNEETVWLTQLQMAALFDVTKQNISLHINNCFREGELSKESVVKKYLTTGTDGKKYNVEHYNLDVIISVGYRVKSIRGVEFRKWANSVLKEYILKGYAVNDVRLEQLGEVVRIMKRVDNYLDGKQILSVIEKYTLALELLDDYDHQAIKKPEGNKSIYVLGYEECKELITKMRFGSESELFAKEKDESFKGSIGAIYQTFDGKEVYPSLEEKAANLLYFITKNHSFTDGNKRIAATIFLHFLDKNNALIFEGEKTIEDYTLVALTIMIAESNPEEKETMIKLVMNFLSRN